MEFYGSYNYGDRHCPKCKSKNVTYNGKLTTLVGYLGDKDPNHVWENAHCRDCNLEFVRESVEAHDNAWCTKRSEVSYNDSLGYESRFNYVIAGLPSCCKSGYLVSCKCGGWAKNDQHGSSVIASYDDSNNWVENPPNIWRCKQCEYSGSKMPLQETT